VAVLWGQAQRGRSTTAATRDAAVPPLSRLRRRPCCVSAAAAVGRGRARAAWRRHASSAF
jgi:hypothetical protein